MASHCQLMWQQKTNTQSRYWCLPHWFTSYRPNEFECHCPTEFIFLHWTTPSWFASTNLCVQQWSTSCLCPFNPHSKSISNSVCVNWMWFCFVFHWDWERYIFFFSIWILRIGISFTQWASSSFSTYAKIQGGPVRLVTNQ